MYILYGQTRFMCLHSFMLLLYVQLEAYFMCSCVCVQVCAPFVLCMHACVFVHVPVYVSTPAALERYRECQEAMEAAGARGAWLSVDADETGQFSSSRARCSIRLDLNIALEHWSCLPKPPPRLCGALAHS